MARSRPAKSASASAARKTVASPASHPKYPTPKPSEEGTEIAFVRESQRNAAGRRQAEFEEYRMRGNDKIHVLTHIVSDNVEGVQ
jgi:hypothetical protein